jgi:hypothetical protein
MTEALIDQLVATIRALPSAERLHVTKCVIESLPAGHRIRLLQQVAASISPAPAGAFSMLGLFADEPDLVDEVCRQAYADRATAQSRQIDE